MAREDPGGCQDREQEQWHGVAHDFVRQELHRVETAAKRVHHRAMTPKIGKGLRDYAHAHLHFLVALAIGLFGANCGGFVNGAQVLLNHFRGDDEVAARFRVERHVS